MRSLRAAVLLLLSISAAGAQSIPGAVLAKREPHHHLAFEDATIRVLRVRVAPHDSTLLHEHDPDYFWVALGASTVVNAKPGIADAKITSADQSVHYTPGKFAHVARNPGDAPFDNITVELLEPQTNVRNLCEHAIGDKPLDCPATGESAAFFTGGAEHPAFATDQIRVSLVTIAPGQSLQSSTLAKPAWVIALDTASTRHDLVRTGVPHWVGGTFRSRAGQKWTVTNRGRAPIHVVTVIEP
ncbi:MAG TPA: hypothetical protein VFJ20_03905 [Gemmatimonadaceae bacterium]|nr:hypothetical protein [Gemmatimonadaceae bacterium]